jgi:hypothetical protein
MIIPLCCFAAYFLSNAAFRISEALLRRRSYHKRLLQIVCFALILIPLIPEVSSRFDQIMYHSKEANAVTAIDIEAFNWINHNTPENATFFVIIQDAGQWITLFTQRRVFPFRKIINDPISRNEADQLTYLMFREPSSLETLELLKKYQIDYIFFGNKTSYDSEKLNVTLFEKEIYFRIPDVPRGVVVFSITD